VPRFGSGFIDASIRAQKGEIHAILASQFPPAQGAVNFVDAGQIVNAAAELLVLLNPYTYETEWGRHVSGTEDIVSRGGFGGLARTAKELQNTPARIMFGVDRTNHQPVVSHWLESGGDIGHCPQPACGLSICGDPPETSEYMFVILDGCGGKWIGLVRILRQREVVRQCVRTGREYRDDATRYLIWRIGVLHNSQLYFCNN